eukprot:878689-Prymnesium_polylepis.2
MCSLSAGGAPPRCSRALSCRRATSVSPMLAARQTGTGARMEIIAGVGAPPPSPTPVTVVCDDGTAP